MNELEKLYRAAPTFDSPAKVDNAVLAAAQRHVNAQTQGGGIWRWAPAASVLSIAVLSLTLVMRQGSPPMSDDGAVSRLPAIEVADNVSESARVEATADIAELVPDAVSSELQRRDDTGTVLQHSAGFSASAVSSDALAEPPLPAKEPRMLQNRASQKMQKTAVTVRGEAARQWYADLQDEDYVIELAAGADVGAMLQRSAKIPRLQPLIIVSGESGTEEPRLFATPVFSNKEDAIGVLQSLGLSMATVRRVSESRSE